MALERSNVEAIAHLARLGQDESEIAPATDSLNQIIGLLKTMQGVDTEGVAPLANPLEITQRLRADTVTEQDHRDQYQQLAPATAEGLYLVPQVIE